MIYFDRTLQERVHELFHRSLPHLGILALGQKESLRLSRFEALYEPIDAREKIYRRIA
jgi:chemotaxis protein methyltransferase CheR